MDGFTPYQNTSYQAPAPWANANTYAPWDPDGAGSQSGGPSTNGANPFSGYGESKDADYNYLGAYGAGTLLGGLPALFGGSQGWFGTGKKRPNITFDVPSYQGSLFTPAEGLPQYYGPSAEGGGANQNLMGTMGMGGASSGGQYGQTQSTPSMAGGFYGSATPVSPNGGGGYDSFMPSYIGQSWDGYGNNGFASGSYGGYGGTQGNNGSGSQGTSLYQPYVPTGGSSSGGFAGYGQY